MRNAVFVFGIFLAHGFRVEVQHVVDVVLTCSLVDMNIAYLAD